jgi:hypothetical protein
VWSKVIAAGITAGLAAIGAVVVEHLENLFEVGSAMVALLGQSVAVPVWSAVAVLVLLLALTASVIILWRRTRPLLQGDEEQPNAVPVVLVSPRRKLG